MVPSALETRCRELGSEIFDRARQAAPRWWQPAYWQQAGMNAGRRYETLKVQLFRFVDVLPALRSPPQIARHLREFLDPQRTPIPLPVRVALGFEDDDGWYARLLSRAAGRTAMTMAQRFIAGATADQAIDFVREIRRKGLGFTLDVLGEYTSSRRQAESYQATYLGLIESLCPAAKSWAEAPAVDRGAEQSIPRVNISIKLTALSPTFDAIDPEGAIRSVAERLRPILRCARDLGAFINVDMESFAYRDLTMRLFTEVLSEDEFRTMTDVGIVIQAYLTDAEQQYAELLEWVKRRGHPIAVRLVKGAYWDMETAMAAQNHASPPVWQQKWQSDACFERLAWSMLRNERWIRPAFATHNVRSMATVMSAAEHLGLTPRHYEFQMLHGMGDPLKEAVVSLGHRLRIYTPYGELIAGMGYLIRRLLENTANDSFLRQSFSARDTDGLLANPAVARPPSAPARQALSVDVEEDEPMDAFHNQPLTSFASAPNRDGFRAALESVRSRFGGEYPLWIDGRAVITDSWIESVNPARPGEVVGRAAVGTMADVDHAVASARRALPNWRRADAKERAALLHKTANTLRRRRFEFAAWMVFEAGKPWREADADVAEAIDYLDYYAYCAERLAERPRRRDLPGEDNYLVYEPKGVCAVIATWSFPLALLCNMTAAALATGNTVVLKPASATPIVAAKLVEVLTEHGLPAGVLNHVPGSGATIGRYVVRHPEVDLIAFTGSRDVGLDILRQASDTPTTQRHIKRVVADLGGKNAIVVDDDADLDEAVGGVVKSAFGYSGQKCTACSRVIVLAEVYDAFCKKLVETTESLVIGPAEHPATVIGPVIDAAARDRIKGYVEQRRQGTRVLLQHDVSALATDGFYAGPTILADLDPNDVLAQEEIFGPVLAVLRARDFSHALEIANGTRYALTGGVYSRSPAHLDQAKREFLVGNLYLNRKITGSRVDVEPFGGLKMSGDGAITGGPAYLARYSNARTITEHTLRHGLASAQEVETRV